MLELMTCNCRRALYGDYCQCRILSLECTDLCKCTGNRENVKYCENEKDKEDNGGEEQGDNESENDNETDVDLEDGENLK